MLLDLYHATDIARGNGLGAGVQYMLRLALTQKVRRLGLFDIIGASRPTAQITLGQRDEGQVGDLAQEPPGSLGDALGMSQVAGVVVGQLEWLW